MVNYVRVSLIALLVVAMAALLVVADAVNHIAYAVPTEIAATRQALLAEIQATRADLYAQLTSMRNQVLALTNLHATTIEADLNYKLDKTEADLNERLNDTNRVINHALSEYDKTALITVQATLEELDPVVGHLDDLIGEVKDQEPLVYSRYLATTGELNKTLDATRRMAEALAKSTPEVAENIKVTSANVAAITTDVAHWTKPESLTKTLLYAPLRMLHVNIGGR